MMNQQCHAQIANAALVVPVAGQVPPQPVKPAINVQVPSQLIGVDFLPTQTNIDISEGTSFMMEGIAGTLVSQTGETAANYGPQRRIIWAIGTIFYLNNNARNQCVINCGHQDDVFPVGTQIILPPGTEIKWGNRLVKISANESVANRTVTLT